MFYKSFTNLFQMSHTMHLFVNNVKCQQFQMSTMSNDNNVN